MYLNPKGRNRYPLCLPKHTMVQNNSFGNRPSIFSSPDRQGWLLTFVEINLFSNSKEAGETAGQSAVLVWHDRVPFQGAGGHLPHPRASRGQLRGCGNPGYSPPNLSSIPWGCRQPLHSSPRTTMAFCGSACSGSGTTQQPFPSLVPQKSEYLSELTPCSSLTAPTTAHPFCPPPHPWVVSSPAEHLGEQII